ncbi:glycosyltransferase [Rhodovarius crocodyli]|uniref:Glycosyltransferase n=1 Tax=Rhodovarius crocodyli TaxID=1979269 RepID=A0A437MGR2_9PROT|nr:glycosyltransferase [Rhodovarius crocodyli]RVT96827.1 glycosyltransferase [Rhodovarius crocodyli]
MPPAEHEVETSPDAPRGSLQSSVDVITRDTIAGWAWDPSRPDHHVEIELLVDGEPRFRFRADQFRPDLRDAGIGDGRAGFGLNAMSALLPGAVCRLELRAVESGLTLQGGAALLIDDQTPLDASAAAMLERMADNLIDAAAPVDELDTLLGTVGHAMDRLLRARARHAPSGPPPLPDMLRGYDILTLEPVDAPEVSIIIPVHNKFELTHACIASMLERMPATSFEVIVVDDASYDATVLGRLVLKGGVRVVRNAENLGFVGTCNAGAAAARGKYLFFLNNDTLMRPGWLDELVATFALDPAIGIVGSRLFFEDGSLQEAGGIIWRAGDGWNWGRNGDGSDPRFSFMRDSDYVSGAALMIERALFEQLNGFDTLYAPAYYEDTDLCFRVRAAGRRVVVQPASEIIHLEGQSNGTDENGPGLKRYQKLNRHKFFQRWKDVLATHRLNADQPLLEVERQVRRRLLFIDESVPTPDKDAGSNAAWQHMLALQSLGFKVGFVPADNMARIDPYTRTLQKHGIECFYHPWQRTLEEVLRHAPVPPDVVYIHRLANARNYLGLVRRYAPRALVLYCVADLHFLRMERAAELAGDAKMAAAAARTRQEELALTAAADCCIVHSTAEAAILEPAARVAVVPWSIAPSPPPLPFAQRHGCVFIGSFGHPPNQDAVEWLGTEVRPLLGDVRVHVYGSGDMTPLVPQDHGNIILEGFAPVLSQALHRHRVAVAPLRYGAGIKGKVLDCLAHGLPCVMTPIAAEGLDLPPSLQWLISADAAALAEKLRRLNEDEALNTELSLAGLAFIGERFGADKVARQLGDALRLAATAR